MSQYLQHFGLSKAPFSTTPDPEFAFATKEHKQALMRIYYYVQERRGIFLLTGEIGAGKTTISHLALSNWKHQPEKYVAAHITDPSAKTAAAFMRRVVGSFGIKPVRNLGDLQMIFREFLISHYKAGTTVVLLLDEAQTIQGVNLDLLQAISNEQTQTTKLLQVVLLAQPNFAQKLIQKPALRSRIAGGSNLNPLTFEESLELLEHRIAVAGAEFADIFEEETFKPLYNATGGLPRDLCVLADCCLFETWAKKERTVSAAIVETAVSNLSFKGWKSVQEAA